MTLTLWTWWLLATSVLLEVAFRAFDPLGFRYVEELAIYFKPMLLDTVVGYRHAANVNLTFRSWSLKTNRDGLPGPELPEKKSPGVYRVLLLGDSVALGWGVPWEKTVGPVLQRLLTERRRGPVEVVVNATGSWNTVAEVRDLVARFPRFDPDAVLLLYVDNDHEVRPELPPDWHGKPEMVWSAPERRGLHRLAVAKTIDAWRLLRSPRASPDREGLHRSADALGQAQQVCDAVQIPFRVVSYQNSEWLGATLRQVQRQRGLVWWDASTVFTDAFERKVRHSPLDAHFNAIGHSALARFIAQQFTTELTAEPRPQRTRYVAASAVHGDASAVPWGNLYTGGFEIPDSIPGSVAALIRVRETGDGNPPTSIGLEWAPPSPTLPGSMLAGRWEMILLPGMEAPSVRRLTLPEASGLAELTPLWAVAMTAPAR